MVTSPKTLDDVVILLIFFGITVFMSMKLTFQIKELSVTTFKIFEVNIP